LIATKIQPPTSIPPLANVNATMFATAKTASKVGLDIQHADAYVSKNPNVIKTRLFSALLAAASAKIALSVQIPNMSKILLPASAYVQQFHAAFLVISKTPTLVNATARNQTVLQDPSKILILVNVLELNAPP